MITLVSWVLFIGLVVAVVRVSVINIQPYFLLIRGDGQDTWVQYIPVIGYVVKTWGNITAGLGAILIWALVQALQVLWIVVGLDRKAHRNALRDSEAYNVGSFQSKYSKKMSRKAQRIPFFFIRWSLFLGLIAYGFDTVVGLMVYPPAEFGGAFGRALEFGTLRGLSWEIMVNMAIMLFSFEALFVPLLVVGQWVFTRNRD